MTDIKQQIKEAYLLHKHKSNAINSFYDFNAGYLAALPRWIPVSEEPKQSGEYLVLGHGRSHFIACFHKMSTRRYEESRWLRQSRSKKLDGITHWMPLPQPPEVD